MTGARCSRCGEPFPTGEPCPGCGEPVTALAIESAEDGSCQHRLLPVAFETLGVDRYRAVAFDGAVIHSCLTERQRADIDRDIDQLMAVDPTEWLSRLDSEHADGAIQREDVEGDEAWNRLTGEPQLFGVETIRNDEPPGWQVTFWVLEFVREEPLESRLRSEIESRLRAVAGVAEVREEDREVYWITGSASGEELTVAGAAAVDSLANELRSHYGALGD